MTFSTVAATGRSDAVVSSWKLESSSTHTSGALPSSSRAISASSAAGLMLPATSQSHAGRADMAPVSAVTVVLPLVPVIATTSARIWPAARRAKSSISPTTSMPRAAARLRQRIGERDAPG